MAQRRNTSASPWEPAATEIRAASASRVGSRRRDILSKLRPVFERSFTLRAGPANERRPVAASPLTWLGHASFRLDSPGGKRVYVDPWLGNPKCPDSEKEPERIDVIALTHGHSDHVGETVELTKKFEPKAVVAMVELKGWLQGKGAKLDDLPGPNKGGTVDVDGLRFTLVNAFHSSSSDEGDYLGEAAGLV